MCEYQVVEHAGQTTEMVVCETSSVKEAYYFLNRNYSPEERVVMCVDVLKDGSTIY